MLKRKALSALMMASILGFSAQAEQLQLAIAFGQSTVDPDTAASVTDDSDSAMLISISHSIADDWKLQLRYSDLGEAEVGNTAMVDYEAYSFAAQYTLPVLEDSDISLYGVLGLSVLEAEVQGVSIEDKNEEEVLLGLGANYALNEDWGVQLEATAYSGEVSAITLGVNKSF